ncbi:MAG: hypothetical protein ACLUE8_10640 [Lachnospiraceae bacterium]
MLAAAGAALFVASGRMTLCYNTVPRKPTCGSTSSLGIYYSAQLLLGWRRRETLLIFSCIPRRRFGAIIKLLGFDLLPGETLLKHVPACLRSAV